MKKFVSFLTVLFLVAACGSSSSQPTTYTTASIDTFTVDDSNFYTQASQVLQADYMFVVDVSASMAYDESVGVTASKTTEFLDGLTGFISQLQNQNIDYQISFINGNFQGSWGMSELTGRGFYENVFLTPALSSTQISSDIDTLQANIGDTLNDNTPVLLEAANQVLTANGSSFIRNGSQLVYIFVSDGDDESENYFSSEHGTTTSDYASYLIGQKGSGSGIAAFVNARAIVAGINGGCAAQADFGEATGTRLAETSAMIETEGRSIASPGVSVSPVQVSSCIDTASTNFPSMLASLAQNVSKPTNIFQLQAASIDTNSINVYVNGVLLSSSQWSYIAASNAVQLVTTPSANATILLTYNEYFDLSQVPANISSIQVSVNGNVIAESSTDGWTYNQALNQIEFGASANIANGATVEVSYQ